MSEAMNLGNVLRSHVSVREFENRAVEKDVRERILTAALAASSTCFLQLINIIRVTDPEKRQALMHLSGEQKHVVEAPEFWVFCVDYRRDAQLVAEADLGWTEQLVAGCLDAGICAQSAMAALEAEGLGGVFVGGLRNGIAEVDKLLQLPEHVVALLGLSFGAPAYKNELNPRLPPAVTVMETIAKSIQRRLPTMTPACGSILLPAAVIRAKTLGSMEFPASSSASGVRLCESFSRKRGLQ